MRKKGQVSIEKVLLILTILFAVIVVTIIIITKYKSIKYIPTKSEFDLPRALLLLDPSEKHTYFSEYVKLYFKPVMGTTDLYSFYDLLDYDVYIIEKQLPKYTERCLTHVLQSTNKLATFWKGVTFQQQEYRDDVQKVIVRGRVDVAGIVEFVPTLGCGLLCDSDKPVRVYFKDPVQVYVLDCTMPLVVMRTSDGQTYNYACMGRNTITFAVSTETASKYSIPYTFVLIQNYLEHYG